MSTYKELLMNRSVIVQYHTGDEVRITDLLDENYGMIGRVVRRDLDDDSYLIEFTYDTPFGKTVHTAWYHDCNDFVLASSPPPVPNRFFCSHDWYNDSYFTTKVYKTCRKCGARHEDEF